MNAAAEAASPSPETTEFLNRKHQLLIDGQWVDAASGETIPVEDPATEKVLGEVALGGAEDIDRAVSAAHCAELRARRPGHRGHRGQQEESGYESTSVHEELPAGRRRARIIPGSGRAPHPVSPLRDAT